MLYNRQSVQDNIRNRDKQRVFYLGKGDQLTSDARDWLNSQRIPILPASEARPERYRLLGGGYLEEKPEHMTHLNGDILVVKTHPRIAFRGALDCLQAELLLCISKATTHKEELKQALELSRNILSHEVLDEPMKPVQLGGLTDEQLRSHSHRPQDFYGQPHFMPSARDGEPLLRVNRARCAARAAELKAVEAFSDREGNPTRPDVLKALNRLSSMLYIIMIQIKAGISERKV